MDCCVNIPVVAPVHKEVLSCLGMQGVWLWSLSFDRFFSVINGCGEENGLRGLRAHHNSNLLALETPILVTFCV